MGITEKNTHFLEGGGELGTLTRQYDWSQTALGLPEQWPQSLRTTVSMVLHSAFPMFLFWGNDLTCFYNDAFRPSLGIDGKHPSLGKQCKDVWPEIWDFIGPLINGVMSDGVPVWFEDQLVPFYRNGRMEDIYWTFSYSPVHGESDTVEGVLVVCTETTGKLNTLKQLQESEDRFRTMAEATDVLIATADETSNATYFNSAWTELTGRPMQDLLEYGWADLIHAEDRENYLNIYLDAFKKKEPFTGEFRILNKKGDYSWLLAKGPPRFRSDGSFAGYISSCIDITERKQAERDLLKSEQRYRMLLEEGTVATALYTGPEMRIRYVNDTMLTYWGKDRSVIGKTFREALPELEGQPFPGSLDTVYATGQTYTGKEEKAYLIIDGKLQPAYYNFTFKALYGDDGTIYGIHHSAINVTEQVQARIKVEEGEQKVRAIVESAPFPIAVYTGKEMRVELANQSIMDIWGKGNDVVGNLFTEVLPELGSQEVFEQISGVYNSGRSFHTKHQRLDLVVNGTSRPYWFNYSFTPLFDTAGNVYGVMNTGVDNTDLILAKLKVEENEKSIRNTILKAPMAMCIFRGPQHVVEIANDRMIELWGKTAEDVMNKPLFEGVQEAKDQGFEQLLDGVYTTGETFVAHDVPITLLRNGKVQGVYVNFVYEAFREADGSISGVIAVATDVTSQVNARLKIEEVVAERTKALAEANSNLQRSNAELAQFAYIASHDLQEPVRKVSTFVQMLEESLGDVDERSLKYLAKISTASSRMTTLIRDVLSYSQLSGEKEVFKPVDLQIILQNIVSDFDLLIEQKQAVIEFGTLPLVYGIPLQMSQLFGNLVSNALKFSRSDVRPLLSITATRLTKDETAKYTALHSGTAYCNIELKDNGIGFKQEHAEQIFNIFQRLHGKAEYAGTGIGLAMCKKIAQNHQGEIFATGTENGAVFNVILPACPAEMEIV